MSQNSSFLKVKQNVLQVCLALLSILLVALLTLGSAGVISAQSSTPSAHGDYSDLEGNYFRNYIDYLVDKDVLRYDTGCDDNNDPTAESSTKFCPRDGMSRWQAAVLIARALNEGEDPTDRPATATFDDVDSTDDDIWWAPHVEFIYEEGITTGCGTGDGFCPDTMISRAQMATMLKHAFNVPETSEVGNVFEDVTSGSHLEAINDVAAQDVAITFGCGHLQAGMTEAANTRDDATDRRSKNFCPADSLRDQLVTLLARAMLYEEGVDTDLDPIDTSAPIKHDTDKAGKELPPTGSNESLLLGSLFIASLAASITCAKIYYDTHKRQKQLV